MLVELKAFERVGMKVVLKAVRMDVLTVQSWAALKVARMVALRVAMKVVH